MEVISRTGYLCTKILFTRQTNRGQVKWKRKIVVNAKVLMNTQAIKTYQEAHLKAKTTVKILIIMNFKGQQ